METRDDNQSAALPNKPMKESQARRIAEVLEAYTWIRQNNQSISDNVLDLMKDSAIKAISEEVSNG